MTVKNTLLALVILLFGLNHNINAFPIHRVDSNTKKKRRLVRRIKHDISDARKNNDISLNWGNNNNNFITTNSKENNSNNKDSDVTTTMIRMKKNDNAISDNVKIIPLEKGFNDNNKNNNNPTIERIELLKDLGIKNLPFGLYETLITNAQDVIEKRFWIVDNSGSMSLWDGHYSTSSPRDPSCTRWCEVEETVTCHAHLSSALSAPTEFRLLNPPSLRSSSSVARHRSKNNMHRTSLLDDLRYRLPLSLLRGPQKFRVGYHKNKNKTDNNNKKKKNSIKKDCERAQSIMVRNGPSGRTPLPDSMNEIRKDIIQMLPHLKATKTKVCIIIATDGCNHNTIKPDDGLEHKEKGKLGEAERNQEFVTALESLSDLKDYVNVVIRLCTDYQPTLDFYNNELDTRSDMNIDVIDDHLAEAEEVYEHNPWLNYALVLHRMREMGQANALFDLLDERPLTKDEIRQFCSLLFWGKSAATFTDENWDTFLQQTKDIQRRERYLQYNPITKSMTQFINTKRLSMMSFNNNDNDNKIKEK